MKLVKKYAILFVFTLAVWAVFSMFTNYFSYGEFLFGKEYFISPIIITVVGIIGDLAKLPLKNDGSVSLTFMWTFIACSIGSLLLMAVMYYTVIDNMFEFKMTFAMFTLSVFLVSIFNTYDKWAEGKKK